MDRDTIQCAGINMITDTYVIIIPLLLSLIIIREARLALQIVIRVVSMFYHSEVHIIANHRGTSRHGCVSGESGSHQDHLCFGQRGGL